MYKKRGKDFLEQLDLLGIITNNRRLKIIEREINSSIEEVTNELKILIIEDHIQIIESYTLVFGIVSELLSNISFNIEVAISCKEALEKLKGNINYDIILLDILLPSYAEANIYSGEDIGLWIDKNLNVKPKIIINTSLRDSYRLYNIYQNVNPDGFLTKEEASAKLLTEAINKVIESPPFYSDSILNMIRQNFSKKNVLDDMDRKLLYELSRGTKIKHIAEHLAYSKTSIDNKKKQLYIKLDVKDDSLLSLLDEARRRGFI